MDRRAFIGNVVGGLLAVPLAAEAQQAARVPRVGWIASFGEFRPTFREAMRELGYVEGKTVVFETRNADGRYDRLPDLVTELITSKVDIIGEIGGQDPQGR